MNFELIKSCNAPKKTDKYQCASVFLNKIYVYMFHSELVAIAKLFFDLDLLGSDQLVV